MKKQIIWKRIDIIGQILMLILPQFYQFSGEYRDNNFVFGLFGALFTVGGWQVLSALLHSIFFPRQYWRGGRRGYNIMLLTILILALLLAATKSEVAFLGLMAMLVIGPAMAIWYFGACIAEITNLVKLRDKMLGGALSEFPSLEQGTPIE